MSVFQSGHTCLAPPLPWTRNSVVQIKIKYVLHAVVRCIQVLLCAVSCFMDASECRQESTNTFRLDAVPRGRGDRPHRKFKHIFRMVYAVCGYDQSRARLFSSIQARFSSYYGLRPRRSFSGTIHTHTDLRPFLVLS